MNTELKIAQINMRNSKKVNHELTSMAMENGLDKALVQDPFTRNGRVEGLGPRTRIVKTDTEKPYAAIAIFNTKLTALKINNLCNSHFATTQITCEGKDSFYLVSGYFQPKDDIQTHLKSLDEILSIIGREKALVCIDSNARSSLWGSRQTDERGREMEDFISENGLIIENAENSPPTVRSEVGEEWLDITLTTGKMTKHIRDWEVREGWTTSDHEVITMTISAEKSEEDEYKNMNPYVTTRANWPEFCRVLKEQWRNIQISENMDKDELKGIIDQLHRAMRKACNKAIPKRSQTNKIKHPWWTVELTISKKEVYRARRKWQRKKAKKVKDERELEALGEVYRNRKRKYKMEIKNTKQESWEKLVTITGNEDPWGIIYKMKAGKLKVREIANNIKTGEGYTIDWAQTARETLEQMFALDTETDETPEQADMRKDNEVPPKREGNLKATANDLVNVLGKMKKRKAPGQL